MKDEHLRSTARCLACLHGGQLDLDTSHLAADEVRVAERACTDLSAVLPTERFAPVLETLRERAAQLHEEAVVPIHRDFYDKQVLVGKAKTYLIDLDTLTLGSRELDLGNFIAHLQLRTAHRGCRLTGATGVFLDEYQLHSGFRTDPLRLSYYLASASFRLACKYRIRPRGEYLAEWLLALAEAALGRRVAA
jgi:aminoglycoside phosphotransferase (APT) family kinase protein